MAKLNLPATNNMVGSLISMVTFMALFASSHAAFVSQNAGASTPFVRSSNVQPLHLFDASSAASDLATTAANNMWLATIDSDIAAIPDNEFTLIFAGGITVMFGGVLSALIVGFIVENGNLYAGLAAESYLQTEDDEEFWKGLSEEERKKGQDVLEKIRQSKKGGSGASLPKPSAEEVSKPESATKVDAPKSSDDSAPAVAKKPADMFSDY